MPNPGESSHAERIARELGDCRHRGIDKLDHTSHNQGRVQAPELDRLAHSYAEARQAPWRGRTAQIKGMLREALNAFEIGNPADAQLIRDLFFGADPDAVIPTSAELLGKARRRRGNPSESRFRDIRKIAFLDFAEFLLDFAELAREPSAAANPPPLLSDEPLDAPMPPGADRRWVPAALKAILRFDIVDPGDTSGRTIAEHRRIIAEYGRCWWGWFKARHDEDHTGVMAERLSNCDVGLWERSGGLFYVARCDQVVVDAGRYIESPERELTPDYYRSQPYPAWLRLRTIRNSSYQEFAERFGPLPNLAGTIIWSPESTTEPIVIPGQGSSVLHIADLRFGSNHRWSTASVPHRSFVTTENAIAQTLLSHDVDLTTVGVVAICGNFVSDEPTAGAFDEAFAFIDGLCEQLPNVHRENVVIVPGADDFARPGDRERANQALYREFHKRLYDDEDLTRMRRYEFGSFRLNVLPVNSVKLLGIDERDEGLFGYGYDRQLNAMREDYLRHHGHTTVVNAVMAHHHLISTPVKTPETVPQEPVQMRVMPGIQDARDVLAKLSASRVTLFLHGHLHEPDCYTVTSADGWRTVVCGAGTAGAAEGWLRTKYHDNHANSLALYEVSDDLIRGRMLIYDQDFRTTPPAREFAIEGSSAQMNRRRGT